jgi:hypothetical protein
MKHFIRNHEVDNGFLLNVGPEILVVAARKSSVKESVQELMQSENMTYVPSPWWV